MKRTGWVIALAAAALTPAMGQAAAPQVTAAPTATAPAMAAPATDAAAAATPAAPAIDYAAPSADYGVPVPGSVGIQHQVTALGEQAATFHNGPLLWMCAIISLFVLVLLGWTMFRYRRGANPTPSRTSHNTLIEVIWTLVPVLYSLPTHSLGRLIA